METKTTFSNNIYIDTTSSVRQKIYIARSPRRERKGQCKSNFGERSSGWTTLGVIDRRWGCQSSGRRSRRTARVCRGRACLCSARPLRSGRGRTGGGRRSRSTRRPGKSGRGREGLGARRSKRYAGSGLGRIEGARRPERYTGSGLGRIAGDPSSTRDRFNFQVPNQSAHLAAQCAPHRLDNNSLEKESEGKAVPGVVAKVRTISCPRHSTRGWTNPSRS